MKTKSIKKIVNTLCVLVCMLSVSPNAWGGGSYNTWLRVETDDTGKGLVYASKTQNQTPADNKYGALVLSESVTGGNGKDQSFYAWAKPARGYAFSKWTGYTYAGSDAKKGEGSATPKANTGTADLIYSRSWGGNAGSDQANSAKASWSGATAYTVTYKEPVGGTYSVKYSYTIIENNAFKTTTETLDMAPGAGDKRPYGISDGSQEGKSYASDVVTLTSSETNFEAWYEDGVQKSVGSGTNHSYTYPITKSANISAVFKNAVVATPEEVSVSTNSKTVAKAASVVFDVETTGTWAADGSDFTIELQSKDGPGEFTITSKSFSAGKLTVNFTFLANAWAGTSVEMHVTPAYGEGASAIIKGVAEEVVDYQARVLVNNEILRTGTLTEMLAYANSLDNTPTLQLTQQVTASSTLQFKKSMILDLNNKKLSATAADKLILVKGNNASDVLALTVTDNSYTKAGEIQLTRVASATSIGLEIADANQVTFLKGKLTVSNTTAAAQGVHVTGTGNLLMKGGKIDVTANSDARGVYAESGFATIQGGQLTASAGTKAYALYTAATANVSEGVSLTATATTGAEAVAIYVKGGTAALDGVSLTATAATTNAYGALVAAGKLVLNGGTVTATGTATIYGIIIASGASASIQQQASVNAEATTGANAYGIENLGTLILANSSVNAIAASNYATAVESKTSAVSTTIEGGTYSATSATGNAYGLHHQFGSLNVDGGSFSATAAGNNVYGGRAAVDGTISNATLSAETTGSGNTAYGFVAGVADKNITLTNCIIKAKSATSMACGIFSRANTTATGCTIEAKTSAGANAYGFYAENGTNVLNNMRATVDSYTIGAYGINFLNGTLSVDGGSYEEIARQATASAATDCKAYGVFVANSKTAMLTNVSFTVTADNGSFSQNAYGAYTGTGTINSTGCTYSVSAAKQAYGVYGAASSTLNLRNNTITATTIGSTDANGIYSAGNFTVDGDDVTSNTKTYNSYPLFFTSAAQGEVLGGKFMAKGTSTKAAQIIAPINTGGTAGKVKVKGGFFSDNVQLRYFVPEGFDIWGVDPGVSEYAAGYYYTVNDHLPYENVCYITSTGTGYPTLEEAFDYARNHSGSSYTIVMTQPYTLPAGNYALPSNATLLVPDRASRTSAIGTTAQRQCGVEDLITENRCLTFAEGANLDAYGTIEVSAKQYTINTGRIAYVLGPYGRIHLEEGSTITLNNGAKINAWGYITGQGEIRVKNGATVREFFQVHDMKAASAIPDWTSYANKNTYKAFLMNQYYIQSVEAPTKYFYGSQLIGSLSITSNATATSSVNADNVKLVGTSDAFFNVDTDDETAWVSKKYDPTTDRIIWETNSSASLGSIAISMSSYSIYSKDYVLPFTNNMTVHALSGKLNITQSTVLLPGSEIIVDKTATLHIEEKDQNREDMGLYLYDQAQWNTNATPIMYSPSWVNGKCPRSTSYGSMKDAAIYLKGKIEVDGYIYTTAGGAAIYSDEANAGTIEFNKVAASGGNLYKKYDGTGAVAVTSAQLRNGGVNGTTFTATKGNAGVGDTYAYANIDGSGFKWTKLKDVDGGCIIADETDPSNPVYYAKPQGYVAITSDEPDEKHLFHSVEGDRLFIHQLMDAGCVWWEVTQVGESDVYHCAANDTYYEWTYLDKDVPEWGKGWMEVKRNVTFYFTDPKDDAADKKKVLTVNYGAKPNASIVSNPTKTADAAATYQFYGWKSSKTQTEYAYTAELETVTEDMYYLPVFTSITKKYTVTFKDAKNGANVPVEVEYGASPEYAAVKASTAQYDYEFTGWKATDGTIYAAGESLPIVEGAGVSYTAQWSNIDRYYDITWKDGDRVIEVDEHQKYGTPTSYDDILPTRATDASNEYTFSGWLSSLDGNTYANGSTPSVGGETTYTAQFDATARYVVKFVNYDGSELASAPVTAGKKPVCAVVPRRDRDAVYYYVWTGWKSSAGTFYSKDTDLPAVTGKETYTAQFSAEDRMYTVTFTNIDNNGGTAEEVFGHSAVPTYNVSDQEDEDYRYFFAGWQGEDETTYALGVALPEVTADATYTALFNRIAKRMEVETADDVPVNTTYTVEEVHVHADGTLTIPESSSINATDLILDATVYKPGIDGAADPASGEIVGAERLNISGKVYFDLTLNTEARTWHAFGVPFEVANLDDVKLIGDGREMTLGGDYEIIYYNGATRASQGPGAHCWGYLKHYDEPGQPVEKLIPGKGYMIAFASHVGKVRFTKAAGAPIVYKSSVRTSLYNSAIEGSNDWNTIATPALFHAALNAGVEYCQVHVPYEIGSDTYQSKLMAEVKFRTGMAVYVQATANRAVVVTPFSSSAPAPRRYDSANREFIPAKYEVTISTAGRTVPMDNLFIATTDEKADGYVTNSDLVKAGTTTKVAQMWVNRYGMKLCVNTMPMEEEAVAYPLTVYAPQTGEYIIAARARTDAGTALYLTENGQAIWNLSDGAYTITLDKGTHVQYGLRLSAKAPQVATGIDEAIVDAQGETRKVIINDQVFIIRGENVYSVDGQLVK